MTPNNIKDRIILEDTFTLTAIEDAKKDKEDNEKIYKFSIRATSCGRVNLNDSFYTENLFKNSLDSWVLPFGKPIMLDHARDQQSQVGRVSSAEFVQYQDDDGSTGYIKLTGWVQGEDAVHKTKTGLWKTVSMKAVPTKDTIVKCSICDHVMTDDEIEADMFGGEHEHEHKRGQDYEGKHCYWIFDGAWKFTHLAFVTEPADEKAMIIEDSVKHTINSEVLMPEDIEKVTEELQDKQNPETDEGTSQDPKETSTETQDQKPAEESATEDETCEDWTGVSEEDAHEAFVLDQMIDETIEEDAKLSPEKRKSLKASQFCGPNRSFPVPDCAHVTAALRLLNRSKFSQSTKDKIKTCVNRKAKSLGCTATKDEVQDTTDETKTDDVLQSAEVQNYIKENFYPKSEMDSIIKAAANESAKFILDTLADENAKKLVALKQTFNTLDSKYHQALHDLNEVKISALKVVRMLTTPGVKDIKDVVITNEDIANFDAEMLKAIGEIDHQDETVPSTTDPETTKQENIEDAAKSTSEIIDMKEMSASAKVDTIINMLTKK